MPTRISRGAIVALAVAAIAGGAVAARGDGRARFSLRYEAVAGCPARPELRAAVAGALGYDPFDDGAATTIAVTVRAARGGVRGRIEMLRAADGAHLGTRELSAASCAELASALELALAVAIDPLHAGTPPPVTTTPPPATPTPLPVTATPPATTTTPPVTPTPPATTTPTPPLPRTPASTSRPMPPRRRPTLRLLFSVGVLLALDSAPGPAFGLATDVGVAAHRWSVALELRGDLPAAAAVGGGHVSASLMAAALVPCVHHRIVALCAVAAAGGQQVAGSGYLVPRSSWVAWAALGGRIQVQLALGRFLALALSADLLAPVTRTELYTGTPGARDGELLFRTPAVQSALGARLSTRWP